MRAFVYTSLTLAIKSIRLCCWEVVIHYDSGSLLEAGKVGNGNNVSF